MSAHFARISSKYFRNFESRRIARAERHSDQLQSRRRRQFASSKQTRDAAGVKRDLDWLPSLTFAVFGAVYLHSSLQIAESFSGGFGHRTVPLAMSTLVMCLAGWIFAEQVLTRPKGSPKRDAQDIDMAAFFTRASPVAMLMALYGLCHIWFGYLAATLVSGVLAFRLLGNPWLSAVIHGIAGTAILYVLFIRLLNVYDPPGIILDLTALN